MTAPLTDAPAICYGPRWPVPYETVRDQVLQTAAEHPEAAAIEADGVVTTYSQLAADSAKIASWLLEEIASANVEEPIVAVVGGRTSNFIKALLAVWRAGGTYLPIDAEYPPERVNYLLQDAAPVALLIDADSASPELIGELTSRYVVSTIDELLRSSAPDPESIDPPLGPTRAAYIIYTSGSTGKPKGAILSHSNVTNFVASHQYDIGHVSTDRHAAVGSVSFDTSVSDVWPTLTEGATLCLAPRKAVDNLRFLLGWLSAEEITSVDLPTAVVNILLGLEDQWWEGLHLRLMLTGGDRLARRPAKAVPFPVLNAYGPTECTVTATLQAPRSRPYRGGLQAPAIGRPILNTFVVILDENQEPCAVGEQGELCIGGAGVGRGYLRRPELTAERFITDRFSDHPGEGKVYRTGDEAILLPNGSLQFVGRSDRQISLQGFRIEAGEVEAALARDPLINEVVAKRYDHPDLGARLVAFITLRDGDIPGKPIELIKNRMLQRVPKYMVPSQFVVVTQMPRTPNGKIDEGALVPPPRTREALVNDGVLSESYQPPRTPMQQRICHVFADVLGMDIVGLDDSFFDIGGDSLAGVALLAALEASAEVELAPDVLQLAPTPLQLANLVDGGETTTPKSRDWDSECQIDLPFARPREVDPDAAVMVTGAGGFVGSNIVAAILADGAGRRVNALVRTQESADALLHALGRPDRLTVLFGDLREPHFGLSTGQWQGLVHDTFAVVHAGAEVNHFKTYEALRSANVGGTTIAAQLAFEAGGGAVPLIQISTHSVVDDAAFEDRLVNGYARSKWVAEQRLAAAADQGLPVRLIRLGRVTPRRHGGAFNERDAQYILFSACIAIEATPNWEYVEEASPADVVGQAVVTMIQSGERRPGFELEFPTMAPWSSRSFMSALRQFVDVKTMAWDEWVDALRTDGGVEARKALALLATTANFDYTVDNTDEILGEIAAMANKVPSNWTGYTPKDYADMAASIARPGTA